MKPDFQPPGGEHLRDVLTTGISHFPEKIAIHDSSSSLTYRQLSDRVNAATARLIGHSVTPANRIAVVAGKSIDSVVLMLAIFRLGAVYIPLDPKLPVDRLVHLLRDSLADFVIVGDEFKKRPPAELQSATVLPLEAVVGSEAQSCAESYALPKVSSDDVAYCIYTSGSTGYPKGVQIKHGAAMGFLRASQAAQYPVSADARCLALSPLHFDVFLVDLVLPLRFGATVYVHSGLYIANHITRILENNAITHVVAISSLLNIISLGTSFSSADFSTLRYIITGAEVVNPLTVARWLKKCPGAVVVNGYGPTEVTCSATGFFVHSIEQCSAPIPIGKPIPGVLSRIVSDRGDEISTPREKGELWLGGHQVMLGYWRRDDLTSEKVVDVDGQRFYKTGDLCEYDQEGNIHYIGRIDDEVKLSGYRIHLNEICRVAYQSGLVEECVAACIDNQSGAFIALAAIIEAEQPNNYVLEMLQRTFSAQLPKYMHPAIIARLSTFPRLPSGKANKHELVKCIAASHGNVHSIRQGAPTTLLDLRRELLALIPN